MRDATRAMRRARCDARDATRDAAQRRMRPCSAARRCASATRRHEIPHEATSNAEVLTLPVLRPSLSPRLRARRAARALLRRGLEVDDEDEADEGAADLAERLLARLHGSAVSSVDARAAVLPLPTAGLGGAATGGAATGGAATGAAATSAADPLGVKLDSSRERAADGTKRQRLR